MIWTVSSIKGGVGKSAMAINLAYALKELGFKVLAWDLDHNNNLTDGLLRSVSIDDIEEGNSYLFLTKKKSLEDCIHTRDDGIDVIPASLILKNANVELAGRQASLLRIKTMVKKLNYDYVIIDSHPDVSFTTSAALFAADVVLTPLNYSRWTVQAVNMLKEEVENIYEIVGEKPKIIAVPSIVTKSKYEKLKESNGFIEMTEASISRSETVATALDKGDQLKEDTKPYNEFMNLAKELLEKLNGKKNK